MTPQPALLQPVPPRRRGRQAGPHHRHRRRGDRPPGRRPRRRANSGDHRQPHRPVDLRQRAEGRGPRAGHDGHDGHDRRKKSGVRIAVDTPGHLTALHVTPASEQDRVPVGVLREAMHEATGGSVEPVNADRGDTGGETFGEAAGRKTILDVARLPEAKKGAVLLPRLWVAGRSSGWLARSRRPARDYERLATTSEDMLHRVAFDMCMLHRAPPALQAWIP